MKESYLHRRIGGRKGKLRLAHHIVWENAIGPIPKDHEIHHLDHDKKNNDIENLICITASEHQKLHSSNFGRLNGKWVRICPDCRNIDISFIRPLCDSCRARRARIERRIK